MVRALPIPLSMLPHTAEYHEYDPESPFQNVYKPKVTIHHVRFELTSRTYLNFQGETVASKGFLYVDAANSYPKVEFTEKSKVVFNGREYYCNEVNPLYASEPTPHHWEITL